MTSKGSDSAKLGPDYVAEETYEVKADRSGDSHVSLWDMMRRSDSGMLALTLAVRLRETDTL
jgi:hypothetical protein